MGEPRGEQPPSGRRDRKEGDKPRSESRARDQRPALEPRSAPELHFPPQLPISARVDDIASAVAKHPVVIVAGATGSGKTTQLPKIALSLGRGRIQQIGVTQPRRIAATSVAARVSSELGTPLGADVGYQIRFDDRTTKATSIKFMTDGILLAEIHSDPLLRRYDTLIIDEAHERSLTIDFLLGWLHRILPERPDLKVIVSSATIETERFSSFFGGAPVVQVEGRTYPVDVLYEPPRDDEDMSVAVANSVESVLDLDPDGDILVFLPGEREIREAESELSNRKLREATILPLYARLTAGEQNRVFASTRTRKVVLATNVAETSLTIPGIVYVIDTGTARLSRYDARSGTTCLQIEAISRASAEQRKGRCGRVRDGICIRLYDELSYAARPEFTDPEIKRTGLAGVILRMKSLDLGDVESFPFIDPVHPKAVSEGYRVLQELGALDDDRELTAIGESLARFPVDPRIGRMILAGAELGCLAETLVITAALNTQDPRERPRDAQQKADDAHKRFRHETSDFSSLLRVWEFVREAEKKGSSNLRRACRDNFLSYMRVREWTEIHRQLMEIVRDLRLDRDTARSGAADEADIHRALLTGLLSKIGVWNPERRTYMGAKQTRFMIHPSSALAKKPPAWVMAFELVETSQLFARTAAKIDPEWLVDVASDQIKRSHADPHWSERASRAMVKETATLFGLTVYRDRNVDYAQIAPREARTMFLEHALVRGEYQSKGAFQAHNQKLLEEVARLRDKARRSDMLVDDSAILAFFDGRVGSEVVNGKSFEAWREEAERSDPRLLELSLKDVLASDETLSGEDYPDFVTLHGNKIPVTYRFDPFVDDDGLTLTIPFVLMPQMTPGELEWTIPGWHEEKLEALLDDLPKAFRRQLGSSGELARTLAPELEPFRGELVPTLTNALRALTGVDIPPGTLRPDAAPPYLQGTTRWVDAEGKVVAEGRDLAALWARHVSLAHGVWKSAVTPPSFERAGIVGWDFGELPPMVTRVISGVEVRGHPALVDRGTSVDLVLMETAIKADRATFAGLRRLLMIAARSPLGAISSRVPAAFLRPSGAPITKADQEVFRNRVLARVTEEAFALRKQKRPTGKAEFEALVARGLPRVHPTFLEIEALIKGVGVELQKTLKALDTASKQPSGKAAMLDIRAQLEGLFPDSLIEEISLDRLGHFPRYLKAAQARLARAVTDPRKDADKLAPFLPVWQDFLDKAKVARDRAGVEELRWSFEELRIAIFAPEQKPLFSVSVQKLETAVEELK